MTKWMCKKKDKTRQSDTKISLMTMIKMKEWWCKLHVHVEQLPIKEAWKQNFRPPGGCPPIISKMLQLANTPPIVRLQEPYCKSTKNQCGNKNPNTGRNYHVSQTLNKKNLTCWVYDNQTQALWWQARILRSWKFARMIRKLCVHQ